MDGQNGQNERNERNSHEMGGLHRVLPPAARPSTQWATITPGYLLKDAFRLHTLLAMGAGLQMAVSACVPGPWRYLPAGALLGIAVVTTAVQLVGPCMWRSWSNGFVGGSVPGRSTAVLEPHGKTDKGRPVVVFHFGARFNHPLGLLAPGARTMTLLFRETVAALEHDQARADSVYGLLGASLFRGGERASGNTILLAMYFRDAGGLRAFATSAVHTKALHWLGAHRRTYPHLSAFHETFCVPAGAYETLYINTAPVLLGSVYESMVEEKGGNREGGANSADEHAPVARARTVGRKERGDGDDGGDGDGAWVNSLVDADDVRLQTMSARMAFGGV